MHRESKSQAGGPLPLWRKILALLLVAGAVALLVLAFPEPERERPGFDPEAYAVDTQEPEPPWPSEVAAAAVGAQLEVLAGLLAGDEPITEQGLAGIAADEVTASALRPGDLAEETLAPFTIRRLAGEPELGAGRPFLAAALQALRAPLAGLADVQFQFEVIGVQLAEHEVSTTLRLEGWGRGARGTQIRARWDCRWTLPGEDGPLLLDAKLAAYEETLLTGSRDALFSDCTGAVLAGDPELLADLGTGIDDWLRRIQTQVGLSRVGRHGLAVGDANGDGLDDVYVCQPGGLPNRLLRQNPDGTVTDIAAESGTDWLDETSAALFVDLDDDGDQDLAVLSAHGLLILANDGNGAFQLETELPSPAAPSSLSAADHDSDGDLDLYACGYGREEPIPFQAATNGSADILYANDGGWSFRDVTEATGLDEGNHGFTTAAVWEDHDDDGDVDLYVARDHGGSRLFVNGGRRFTSAGDAAPPCGAAATWGDVDGDGRMDLHLGGVSSAASRRIAGQETFAPQARGVASVLARQGSGGALLLGSPGGALRESAAGALSEAGWGWASLFADLNQDGQLDLVVANGNVTGKDPAAADEDSFFWQQVVSRTPPDGAALDGTDHYAERWAELHRRLRLGGSWGGGQRNRVFLGTGESRFVDVSNPSGLAFPDDARSLAMVDWDGDGDLDLWSTNRTAPRLRFARNDLASPGQSLQLRLQGRGGNRDAIGARVSVTTRAGDVLVRSLRAGEGFLGQSSKWLHFGLGDAEVAAVTVRWPRGLRESFGAPRTRGRHVLVEGAGACRAVAPREPPSFLQPTPLSATGPPGTIRVILAGRPPQVELWCQDSAGGQGPLPMGGGRPLLLNLWSMEQPACRAELLAWRDRHAELTGAGLDVLAMCVDDVLDPAVLERSGRFAAELALPFRYGWISPRMRSVLAMYNRALFSIDEMMLAPTTLLIDGEPRLVAVYRGVTDVDTLVSDAALCHGPPASSLPHAVPFRGRWRSLPPRSHVWLWELGAILTQAGLGSEAQEIGPLIAPMLFDSDVDADRQLGQELRGFYIDRTMSQVEVYQRLDNRTAMRDTLGYYLDAHLGDPGMTLALAERINAIGASWLAVAALRSQREATPGHNGVSRLLAWMLAAHPDDGIRDAAAALVLAQELQAAVPQSPEVRALLAAAQAESGDLRSAAGVAREAARLAREAGRSGDADALEARARGYEAGELYRLPLPGPRAGTK